MVYIEEFSQCMCCTWLKKSVKDGCIVDMYQKDVDRMVESGERWLANACVPHG
jgi:hypothetical protein